MTSERKVPKATMQRYPVYLKALRRLKASGVKKIMSRDFGVFVMIEPTTIRRDFTFLGCLGKKGYGYDVDELIRVFSDELGFRFAEKIILVGCGNLGKALLNYNKWNHVVGEIICGFDIDPSGKKLPVPVYDINNIAEKMPEGCRIAILCITKDVQKTVDILVANGIKGIVNFTSEHFRVPANIYLKHVDIVSSIQELVFETNELNK